MQLYWCLHVLVSSSKNNNFQSLFVRGMSAERSVRLPHSFTHLCCFPAQLQHSLLSAALMRTLLVEGAGHIINLFPPNHIFPVSPGTGHSPITDLIWNLCRRLLALYVHRIASSIKQLISIFSSVRIWWKMTLPAQHLLPWLMFLFRHLCNNIFKVAAKSAKALKRSPFADTIYLPIKNSTLNWLIHDY